MINRQPNNAMNLILPLIKTYPPLVSIEKLERSPSVSGEDQPNSRTYCPLNLIFNQMKNENKGRTNGEIRIPR
jgi:hypothetical protein